MQRDPPPDPFVLPLLALAAAGVFGLVYAVLGSGRRTIDYALGAVFLFGGSLVVAMAVASVGRIVVQIVRFFESRKAKKPPK
jgi:hypothetical protein